MKKNRNKNGFTLVELMVSLSIISLIAAVVLASMMSARHQAANSRAIFQNREFAKSFAQLSLENNGLFPPTSSGTSVAGYTYMCLGTDCVFNSLPIDTSLVSAQLAPYISSSANTADTSYQIGNSGYEYRGTVYSCLTEVNGKCTEGQIYYPLYGTNCPGGAIVAMTDGKAVLCTQDIGGFTYNAGNSGQGSVNDTDGDSILNSIDNCPNVSNLDQADTDLNGVGDLCDSPIAGSCQGTFADTCDYSDYENCVDLSPRSGYCSWGGGQSASCLGNYNFSCNTFDEDSSSCNNAYGCNYNYEDSTCDNGQQTGNCDGYNWGQEQCQNQPGCIYIPGTNSTCSRSTGTPQCEWYSSQSDCGNVVGCSWTQ